MHFAHLVDMIDNIGLRKGSKKTREWKREKRGWKSP